MSDVLSALGEVCADVREGLPEEGVLGVLPAMVAAPRTVAEAAEVMRVAAERDLAVVPRGNETRLDWGRPPARCDLLVDTTGLDRVIEHAAGDLVVKVEAGLTVDRLAEVLAAHGQRLALDVPLPGSTVGGTLAAAAGGPSRLLYGSARDLLIGVTMVRADGRIAKAGGKVVKNVAGYDLGKLLTGSFGTLGLIVEAAFRLHPLPEARAYVTAGFGGVREAYQAVQQVLHSHHVPSAIEVDTVIGGPVTVGVLVEGVQQGVGARAAAVAELLGPAADVADAPPDWWGAYPGGSTLVEVTAPPTALPRIVAELAEGGCAGAVLRGSAGVGGWHVGLEAGEPPAVAGPLARLRRVLAPLPGGAVVRYAPEAVREEIDLWGPVPALPLMRRVKDQFDPGHRLSPGRFAGGI
ncbi:glycolate oxidase FAD binding subunit [Thermomonospora echinospora]|uniref:Glycolate oxidase FAD binding subunit n=1 Tax=Thermomonospora echinospora TaxID=1992 RepID=A0A1H6BJX1_9ACTN|nr:FAD-binding oxidoreductase [Thermomonospora echinospora]SEG60993.1 glycolate oxidase FAD binding subunit [Thermomonospora echinospora]